MKDSSSSAIHAASLSLLEDPGIRIEHDEVLALLKKHGARPGAAAQVVRFPAEMIRDALAAAPKTFSLTDRAGRPRTISARSDPIFWSCPGMSLYRSNKHRPFTSADMADAARLLERLDNVHGIFGMALDDVPPPARDVAGLNIIAKSSTKHVRVLCFSPAGADRLREMRPIVGEHPWFSVGFTAHGPLRWTNLAIEIFRRTAGCGIPASLNGEPMAGVSGPVTLAGAAAVGNAEILAGLVVNQLLEPGRPCIYNLGLAHIFDMKTAVAVTGGPENAILAGLSAAMGRFYDLPSASWVSTEAVVPDEQAALEKMLGFHGHMASGVSNIWGVGQLESEITFSPAQAVIDNEMISFARRYLRGCKVDDATLAVDVTRETGISGSFLEHPHTLQNFRAEFFEPRVLFRKRRADWETDGRPTLSDRAEVIADDLISRPVDCGLSADQLKALDDIAQEFIRQAV